MNKTININLGGFFFHIDETAYQKLKRYLDSIARSLSDDPQGKNEIIADIEARISELLSERIADARQVVNEGDIDEIIAIMGEPEDYADTEEGYSTSSSSYQRRSNSSKKLFRDGDDKFLGGVAAGIAHYLGIDVIWVRLLFIAFFFGGGFSLLLYIILWILLPEAKTTTEKLQMEGEAVNIDNIEKKIREELGAVTDTIKDGASEVTQKVSEGARAGAKKAKSGFQDFLDALGKILLVFFKVIGKFIGVILILVASLTLISLVIGGFSVGSFGILGLDDNFVQYPPFFYESVLPRWLLAICLFVVIGFPFLILFVLGLRILSSNIKQFSKTTSLTLLGIWLIALFTLIFSGIEFISDRAHDGSKTVKTPIEIAAIDTLRVKMVNNEDLYYQHNFRRRDNQEVVIIDDAKKVYSNYVKVDIKKSNTDTAYLLIRKRSEGKSRSKANANAEELEYYYELTDQTLHLNGYFLSGYKNLFKDEGVTVTMYIPENTVIYLDHSTRNFLYHVDNTTNIYDKEMAAHHFIMSKDGLACTDCTEDEWEKDDNNVFDETSAYLFDSTINDFKAELIVTKETTKSELRKLVRWFKDRKNIDIHFDNSTFFSNGKIKKLMLKVDCNDGYYGNTSKGIVLRNGKHGFIRSYNQDGEASFRIW